jgi:hypothetical protein
LKGGRQVHIENEFTRHSISQSQPLKMSGELGGWTEKMDRWLGGWRFQPLLNLPETCVSIDIWSIENSDQFGFTPIGILDKQVRSHKFARGSFIHPFSITFREKMPIDISECPTLKII